LTEEGEEGPCGWLKDKFGVSSQIVPSILTNYLTDEDKVKRNRVEKIVFQMKKFDIEIMKNAYEGI
jgi:predicted 3-demethylubiquinone-9 3-methyltransferase (glyoxalase superfamily)